MTIIEKQMDLFDVSNDYILVHCISSDFALGAGIAKQFTKRGVKKYLQTHFNFTWNGNGYCIASPIENYRGVFNLVTKKSYYDKPTYKTLEQSLIDMKNKIQKLNGNVRLAMPRIGCGLDKLEWEKVKEILKEVFYDTDISILVCYL